MDRIKISRLKCQWRVAVAHEVCNDMPLLPDSAMLYFRRLGQSQDCAKFWPSDIRQNILEFTFGDLLFNNPGRYEARLEVQGCPCDVFEFVVGDSCVTKSHEVVAHYRKKQKGETLPSNIGCSPVCKRCDLDPCACCQPKPEHMCREFCRVQGIGSIRSADNVCAC